MPYPLSQSPQVLSSFLFRQMSFPLDIFIYLTVHFYRTFDLPITLVILPLALCYHQVESTWWPQKYYLMTLIIFRNRNLLYLNLQVQSCPVLRMSGTGVCIRTRSEAWGLFMICAWPCFNTWSNYNKWAGETLSGAKPLTHWDAVMNYLH